MALTPEVAEAIEQLQESFPDSVVTHREDGSGGAFVKVDPLLLGDRYNQRSSWIGFHLTYNYPEADVYPHFGAPGLKSADGTELTPEAGFNQTQWGPEGAIESVTQFSRRSNHWNPAIDNAAIKLQKVLAWLR